MKPLPVVQLKGQCTGCGDCCRVVTINRAAVKKAKAGTGRSSAPGRDDFDRTSAWMRDDLTAITRAEAYRRLPNTRGKIGRTQGTFTCRHFDEVSNRCLNYENRPSVCRDFPWYGKKPGASSALDSLPNCGYRADLIEEAAT